MNLKVRFAVWFAVFVALILSLTFSTIYYQAQQFRREEFFMRLRQKAMTTHRLLVNVDEIDNALLRKIDQNNLNALTDQKIVILDAQGHKLYSNVEDSVMRYDVAMINKLEQEREIRISEKNGYESLAFYIESPAFKNIILASAYDTFGLRQLRNLANTLLITWILGLTLTVYLAYIYVRRIVGKPLLNLTNQIASIGEGDLKTRLEVPENQDELTILAKSFNEMLHRLASSFESQRSFVQFASHELRTPLANMLAETENMLAKDRDSVAYKNALASLREEQVRLIDLTNTLLVLTRYENLNLPESLPQLRVDEVLYNTIEEINSSNRQYRVNVSFGDDFYDEKVLILRGNESLLRTAFRNLIDNACKYSSNQSVNISIVQIGQTLRMIFENIGNTLNDTEAKLLFTPFFRGINTSGKRGFGLGLVIAQRILKAHNADIEYSADQPATNQFVISFKIA